MTVLVKDAGQAYEQTLPWAAIRAFAWALAWVRVTERTESVSVSREELGRSKIGGIVPKLLELGSLWIVFSNVELLQMFAAVLGICLVQVGSVIFYARCVTIGNPFGRIAIAAVTGREEVLFDARWKAGDFEDPKWREVSRKYAREEVFALSCG